MARFNLALAAALLFNLSVSTIAFAQNSGCASGVLYGKGARASSNSIHRTADAKRSASCACQSCGQPESVDEKTKCRKVCKLIVGEKLVKVTCYKSEFEDFCVPNPSEKCCEKCVDACSCENGGSGKKMTISSWKTSCGEVKTRKKLMKKTFLVKVPDYRWEIVAKCNDCESASTCVASNTELPKDVPAPPRTDLLLDLDDLKKKPAEKPKAKMATENSKHLVQRAVVADPISKIVPPAPENAPEKAEADSMASDVPEVKTRTAKLRRFGRTNQLNRRR